MKIVKINSEFITLSQFLKITDIINSGGEAKFFLIDNNVYIDEVLEKRRGRKIYPGMFIKYQKNIYKIEYDSNS